MLVRGACPHDCPDTCAWEVEVEDGCAVGLAGNKGHPFTRGGLCAKVNHFLERAYSDERLLHPLRRVGPKGSRTFERVGWDEAIADIGARLRAIVDEHGGEAVLPYSYMGTQGLVQSASLDRRFFGLLGATRLVRAICGGSAAAGQAATLGSTMGMLPEQLAASRLILLWGTNTIVTNLHLWPFIRRAREEGARVVVIDPLRTRTTQSADQHVRPMPGTDAALALGMMHVIVRDGLHNADYVEHHTVGFEQLCERLQEYPPDRVAAITRVPEVELVELAHAYATIRPAAIRRLIGLGHHAHGAMTLRTISCLPALVGAWRDVGGGLVGTTAWAAWAPLDTDTLARPELEDDSRREVNMVQLGRALTELEPPIRALVVYNSNPAAIAPNQSLVLDGLRRDDLFTVVLEQFMTDTAAHADYVLPATTQLEHVDLVPSWGHTYITLNWPAIEPLGEALPNTEIFRRLAGVTNLDQGWFGESDEELVQAALSSGHPLLAGVTFEHLLEHGYARAALPDDFRPYADGGFSTPSGKCEFYSEELASRGIDPLPGFEPARESPAGDVQLAARYPLALLTGKSALHFLNSSYANLPRHLKAEREPLLDLHPDDAAPRAIADGDLVRVFNDRGSVELRVRVDDRVRAGVAAMPSGWWASLSRGGTSANSLTSDGLSDWGGGGDFHDTLVEVERAAS